MGKSEKKKDIIMDPDAIVEEDENEESQKHIKVASN